MTESAVPPLRLDEADLDALVTRRPASLFASDLEAAAPVLRERLAGARVLVVGGAGSIGASTVRLILGYRPAALHVVDRDENGLAELIRDLRGRPGELETGDLRTLPLDYGGPVMARFLAGQAPYDLVLNFAALKHVRSEKDVPSLLQMLDTNIVGHARFKRWLLAHGHGRGYFAVSTDKAANPVGLMGASKRLMEDVAFDVAAPAGGSVTSARFANVAFSNGSLLHGFLRRLERGQPLAVPRATRRYFVSRREAGELCLIAALAVPDRHVAFPRLDPRAELQELEEVAVRLLHRFGFEPAPCEDEAAARRDAGDLIRRGRWPLLRTPLDTSGEKPYEEFVGKGEVPVDIGLGTLGGLRHVATGAGETGLFETLETLIGTPDAPVTKERLVELIGRAIPVFQHVETGRNLDQRF